MTANEQKQAMEKKQGSLWQLVAIIALLVLAVMTMTGLLVNNSQTMIGKLTQLKTNDMKFQTYAQQAYNGFLTVDDQSNMWVGLGVGSSRFGDQKLADDTQSQAQAGALKLTDSLKALLPLAATPSEQKDIQKAQADATAYLQFFDQVQQFNAKDHRKAQQLEYVDNANASNALTQDLQNVLADADNRVVSVSDDTLAEASYANQVNWIGGGLLVLLSLVCLLFTWRTTHPIVTAVRKINAHLQRIAAGDLTDTEVKVKARGEIGQLVQAVNMMTGNLRDILVQVKETALLVASSSEELNASTEMTNKASEEIANAIQEISVGSERQVEVVESGSRLLVEINGSILRIAGSAETVTQRATEASQVAADGSQAVTSAVDQMQSINRTMEHLQQVVRGLGERSAQIGKIVEAIADIAGQTNLLALNAAIESARAGEHGRGFAVVADEVRKLAEQSTRSAQGIGDSIEQIQLDIQEAVNTMEASAQEVLSGTEVVNAVGSSFARIQQSVEEVAEQIREVSAASHQMTTSTELTDAMQAIASAAVANARGTNQASAFTQEQVATMEEIAASTAALTQLAEELQVVVEKFQI